MPVSAVTQIEASATGRAILKVNALEKTFTRREGLFGRMVQNRALNNVSFELLNGEILGLVGESGSGKSTIGKIIVGLEEPDSGEVILDGKAVIQQQPRYIMPAAQRGIGMIFQDPYSSLNPRMSVGDLVGEGLRIAGKKSRAEIRELVAEALVTVGLRPEDSVRYPHQFSGGQRQRIGIARSVVMRPKVLIADEAVSSLDVSVQMQVLNLLLDIRETIGLSLIFITHNIGVVEYLCDRLIVLSRGEIVERGEARSVIENPSHDYSRKLIGAVPRL